MSEVKSGFRRLLELTDKSAREELNSYYIISESRMDNYLNCLEDGAKQIAELRTQLSEAQKEIERLDESESFLIAERDNYEEVVENVAIILGCRDEWTSSHDHRRCIAEYAEEMKQRAEKAEAENEILRARLKGMEEVYQKINTAPDGLANTTYDFFHEMYFAICAACEGE